MAGSGLTPWALDRTCDCCGARRDTYYEVRYYVLPAGLVRKRHRGLSRTAIYCRACFEHAPELPILLGGGRVLVPKRMRIHPTNLPCLACGTPFCTTGELYGILSYSLIERGACIKDRPLGFLLRECVETYAVTLLQDIRGGPVRPCAGGASGVCTGRGRWGADGHAAGRWLGGRRHG
jgi:hypothetical protein